MLGSFDIHNLKKLLKDFYTAVGIRISVFDDEFKPVTEYPETAPLFCTLIRGNEKGKKGCKECDAAACLRAKKLHGPHIYTCHAGLTEAITPIRLSGGIVGYAILAHMMPQEDYEKSVASAVALAEKYGVARSESVAAIKKIPPRSKESINAAVKILDVVAGYFYISNMVQWKNEDISSSIEKYVKRNLAEEISAEDICKQFHCSRSYLYSVSQRAFGMGIMQYVTYCRIERAKELLLEGESVAETAQKCGFSDYSYFCKRFLKQMGVTPAKFKKGDK